MGKMKEYYFSQLADLSKMGRSIHIGNFEEYVLENNILKFPTLFERWIKEAEENWNQKMVILKSLSEEEIEELFNMVEES